MRLLHILKSEPDENTRVLMRMLSGEDETSELSLYGEAVDYDRLLDLVFEHDRVISWW